MSFNDTQRRELAKPLDKKNVASRTQSGRAMSYVEGWHVIAEANRIFGFDGWTRETIDMREVRPPELVKNSNGKETWRVGFICKVRVTAGGVVREGTGFGSGALPDLGEAYESAVKESETDAMKRALMTFGNPFGLALYDKTQANVVDEPRQQSGEAATAETARAEYALRNAPSKLDLKAVWDAIAWDLLSQEQASQLTTAKDARLADLNTPKPPKTLGEHLDNLERQAAPANPN